MQKSIPITLLITFCMSTFLSAQLDVQTTKNNNKQSAMGDTQLIEKFYSAFQNEDAAGMIACYHDDVEFTDPAFGTLKGARAKSMWEMLLSNGSELKVDYSDIEATASGAKAHWEAHYSFGKKKRPVHNIIDAQFEFKDGLIIKHVDTFSVKKWAGQAMGFSGKLLGGTKFFKKKLNAQTSSMLDKYLAKK